MNTFKRCRVCGDSATGIHYRCLCCQSCKIFFHRYAHKKLVCIFGGDCIVDIDTRKFCQCCRQKACFQNGMIKGKEIAAQKRRANKKSTFCETSVNQKNASTANENNEIKTGGHFDAVLETTILKNITLFDVEMSKQSKNYSKISSAYLPPLSTPLGNKHRQFGSYELFVISTLQKALSVFGDENACQKEQIAVSLKQFYHLPEVYVRWTVKAVKRLPAFTCLNAADQFILFKPFSYNILVIRISFHIVHHPDILRVFANNEADEVVLFNFSLGKQIKHTEAWNNMVKYGRELSLEMEGDPMIRDLLTAQLLFTPSPNRVAEENPQATLSCLEYVLYQQSLYSRLLRQHLKIKYHSRAVAMRKYSNLLGLLKRLTTFKETEIFLYQSEYGNLQELSGLELEMYNLTTDG